MSVSSAVFKETLEAQWCQILRRSAVRCSAGTRNWSIRTEMLVLTFWRPWCPYVNDLWHRNHKCWDLCSPSIIIKWPQLQLLYDRFSTVSKQTSSSRKRLTCLSSTLHLWNRWQSCKSQKGTFCVFFVFVFFTVIKKINTKYSVVIEVKGRFFTGPWFICKVTANWWNTGWELLSSQMSWFVTAVHRHMRLLSEGFEDAALKLHMFE